MNKRTVLISLAALLMLAPGVRTDDGDFSSPPAQLGGSGRHEPATAASQQAAIEEITRLRKQLGLGSLVDRLPGGPSESTGEFQDREFAEALRRLMETDRADRSSAAAADVAQVRMASQPTDRTTQVLPSASSTARPASNLIGDTTLVGMLRNMAWNLDQAAHTREVSRRYEEADRMRLLAERLRQEARTLDAPHPR